MKIALIENEIVNRLIIGELTDFPGWIDVTGKFIGEGFTDNGDGTFTDNRAPVLPPAIRKITIQAFYRRMTQGERTSMRSSSPDVADLREDLNRSPLLNLDGSIESQLQAISVFDQARIDELLVDGTSEETSTG